VAKNIRSIAVTLAVLIFFVMACVGMVKGYSPATCASRAFFGAAIAYLVVSAAARAVMNIIIDAILESKLKKSAQKDNQQ